MPIKIEETARYILHELITPGGVLTTSYLMAHGDIGVVEEE